MQKALLPMALSAPNSGLSYRASVTAVESAGEDIRLIRLRPATPFYYKAGQFIYIAFDGLSPRPYSIASAPGSESFEVHIKRGNGPASTYALEKLTPGEEIRFSGPDGQGWLDENSREPVIAIAGGLGIAPIKAIIEDCLETAKASSFTLYWGTFRHEDRYLEDYFRALAAKFPSFHYRPVTGTHVGDAALADIEALSGCRLFVSGPPAMIAELVPRLIDRGAARNKIRYDRHPEAAGTAS